MQKGRQRPLKAKSTKACKAATRQVLSALRVLLLHLVKLQFCFPSHSLLAFYSKMGPSLSIHFLSKPEKKVP